MKIETQNSKFGEVVIAPLARYHVIATDETGFKCFDAYTLSRAAADQVARDLRVHYGLDATVRKAVGQ